MIACCLQRGVRRHRRSQEDPGVQRWEPHQHASSGLILGGRRGNVLGDGVDIAEGPLQGTASGVRRCEGVQLSV